MKIRKRESLEPISLLEELEDKPSYEVWDEENRVIFINNDINESIMDLFKLFWKYSSVDKDMEPNERKPIKIFINSKGGDATCAMSIVDLMNSMITPIWTINIGECYSAATHIFAAGFKRFALQNSTFMVHDGSVTVSGEFGNVKKMIDNMDEAGNRLNEQLIWASNIKQEDIESHNGKDWYFFADDALDLGLVDEIVDDFEYLCY